jgi:hypothetical protein
MKSPGKLASAISTSLLLGAPLAHAETGTAPEQIDTVYAFNEICYTKVPAVGAIRDMALELDWKPLDNEDLQAFGDKENLASLEGWDIQVGEKFYRLGLAQGPVADDMKAAFPEFADGVSTSCSMVLDGSDSKEHIAGNMQTLAGREPASSDVEEGHFLSTTWAGGNAEFKVFLFNKASKTGEGGVIAVTVISKN